MKKIEELSVKIFADGADKAKMLEMITVTNNILKKLKLVGYNLDKYSLDTVKMFYNDALQAAYSI